ncbi:AraC family transcriptional regulator [Cytophaga sp. FL35]|uniref:AraC family transcriptional regulator n=1 Tax=Cytophaga sp. FL35 TaxID=1904456 RepID=UPI00165367C8|nr:AraC family transcriptional regulator [Cytophaga sp. FL35]MBC6996968.1 helix-turn-helix transcriptional regulator [Cytophaga sp. FL35]
MKPLPFKIPKPKNEALVFQIDREQVFYDQFHQHAEIQLSQIRKGSGSLLVGDTLNEYREGDILLIGGLVPHVFKSDSRSNEESLMYTLFFGMDSFGKGFFELPDLAALQPIFNKANYGIKLTSHTEKAGQLFDQLPDQPKIAQLGTLFQLLHIFSFGKIELLSSFVYDKRYSDVEGKRMGTVMQYVMDHYHEPLSLDLISKKAHMSKNAFCRYFKKRTNKTFFQFLIEIRVENACKQLVIHPEKSIYEIGLDCGFFNISNFNRQFKGLKGDTPSIYRNKFRSI